MTNAEKLFKIIKQLFMTNTNIISFEKLFMLKINERIVFGNV